MNNLFHHIHNNIKNDRKLQLINLNINFLTLDIIFDKLINYLININYKYKKSNLK